jgi:RND superfamily putative drug exporter
MVLLGWLLVLSAGLVTTSTTISRFTSDFSLPGQPGFQTSRQIQQNFGTGGSEPPLVLTTTVARGRITDHRADIARVFAAAAGTGIHVRTLSYADTRDLAMLSNDGRTAYGYVFLPSPTSGFGDSTPPQVIAAAQHAAGQGVAVGVTGYHQLSSGSSGGGGNGVLAESLIAAVLALGVLAFVFGSLLALLPLVMAAVSIFTTFLVLLGVTYLTDVNFVVQFLIALVGLGVSIDYSLIVVSRWREERARGADNHMAVIRAVQTAGRAVLFSGVTVAVGLLSLIVLPVPFLRSIGYGGMLIPLISTAVALTLLPAILGGIGPRLDRPRHRFSASASPAWTWWASAVVRRRWLAACGALAALVILALPFTGIRVGLASSASLTTSGPAYDALHSLTDHGVGTGVITPIEVLVSAGDPRAIAQRATQVDGVAAAYVPRSPSWHCGALSLLEVVPASETVAGPSTVVIARLDAAIGHLPGVIGLAGAGPDQRDYIHGVYGNFGYVLAVLAVLTYLLLARAFRSLLLPLKALALNLLSLGATFGAMVFFWQNGRGSHAVFGIAATGAIIFWVPVVLFAFLYGLSMDYEVFILARMRETYDELGSTKIAVVQGLGRTGRLVTSAALILFLSFVSLSSAPGTDIKVLATGLGFGILLDATVIRALLVPALVSVFGSANWYLPDWAARLLHVPPRQLPATDAPEPAEMR